MTNRRALLESALSKLSEEERIQILSVVNKDEIIRVRHELHIMRLKSELQVARRKGAIKSGEGASSARACARCRAELGRIINRGAFCRWCRHRVCKNCREYTTNQTSDWLCTVCFKHMELTAASGEWMNQFVRRPSKRRENRIAAVETVKRLQRSWTFSDASPSPWAALRNSPEMRAYSSMPRHRDCEFITRTAFTNCLNLSKTSNTSEPSEQTEITDQNKEEVKDDDCTVLKTDSGTVEEKASDSEPSFEENVIPVLVTDNESSIGSPLIDKRSLSESTSVDQSSIGSPIIENRFCHDSPVVSSSESPLVEKRTVNDAVIEPLTGTVFRKVTLKKRRVDMRNLPPGVTPPRSRRTLVPEDRDRDDEFRDDYKLVFISSSDSSSREELQSDDGSSTCSGLVTGSASECDWDYFEPGGGGGGGSSGGESQSSVVPHQSQSVSATCGECVPVPIPVPIPVPVPVLVPVPWTPPPDLTIRIQHLWSMQQLVTVTLGDQMSQDLRLAALKHFQDLVAIPSSDIGNPGVSSQSDKSADSNAESNSVVIVPEGPANPENCVISRDNIIVETSVQREVVDVDNSEIVTEDALQSVEHDLQNRNNDLLNNNNLSDNSEKVDNIDEIGRVEQFQLDNKHPNIEIIITNDENTVQLEQAESFVELQNNTTVGTEKNAELKEINLGLHISEDIETDGVVLKNYKKLDSIVQEASAIEEVVKQTECLLNSMEEVRDNESVCSSTSSEEGQPNKRSYKLNDEENEEEGESSEDESSGEFSGGSSLSSSPGSGRFKRVYVVNDSDSDLGELPESQVNDEEDGEVKLIRHENFNMDEIKLSTILYEPEKKDIGDLRMDIVDGDSVIMQDSLECGVLHPELELPESEHEAAFSLPATDDKPLSDNSDKCIAIESTLDSVESASFDNYDTKRLCETDEFLSREIEYCDKAARKAGEFVLAQTVAAEGSDEECGKVCETRGSNTSDEFSGTESMELEQGQIRAGGPVTAAAGESCAAAAGRYTSLVMITQEPDHDHVEAVNVVTSDTTTLVPEDPQPPYTLTLDTTRPQFRDLRDDGEVHVVTGNGTTAVVILEDGLPDDDSWVEDLDRDEPLTTTEESSEDDQNYVDREEELRGYNPRSAIDFTLHTIVEESCEESEVEMERNRPTELEKYFFYGVGDGLSDNREVDTMSETSSIHSEGLESLGGFDDAENEGKDPAELASSRLEKYFLSGLLGCSRRDSDGSVGSDSEGKPSPEQRRKRLVRARGTGRQHSNSQDNLHESEPQDEAQPESEGSSTETDSHDDLSNSFEKSDGQFDTVKRTKKKKRSVVSAPSLELLEAPEERPGSGSREELDSDGGNKTPQPEFLLPADLGSSRNKQQSRDSGFMGSCDDLLKDNKDVSNSEVSGVPEVEAEKVPEIIKTEETVMPQVKISPPTGLIRKDSFNNWSSDEETNLMMSKMRQFFKTMVASQKVSNPNVGAKSKPPQLVHFESELTRLMKTVPGIRDEQVKEIVEYLSSEDTWSDSYDSSDYTSSDLESGNKKSALQEEISASCRQIISNFEAVEDPASSTADGVNKDTAFVYQRLVASFSKLDTPSSDSSASHNSPPLIAKVMQHIGSRLVALMHEVSSAEGGSPKTSRYHRRVQPKLSTTSTTEDEEDSIEDYSPLPRSKSHDPLIEENRQEASDNERFSWRGSFESALMASDSRQRLASTGEASASALALAAKRRSAGDLLFKTSSREQLDRVRSCGSIGGSVEDKIWGLRHQKRRRSSVPDSGGSNDGDDDSEEEGSGRSTTLPRSLQSSCAATNSLPRLPTTPTSVSPSIYKAHSVHQVSASKSVVSARYRPPGYSSRTSAVAPPRRDAARRRAAQTPSPCNVSSPPSVVSDDASVCSESVSVRTPEDEDRLPSTRASLGTGSPLFRSALHHDIIAPGSTDFNDGFHKLKARSDSLASVYSGAGEGRYGSVAVKGEVEFGLQYNYKQGALEIYVKQCRDLAAVDTKRNRSDPYVKVYLLPDKSKSGKRKTRVKKHTLNPVFEETLKFHITLEGLESRTLWLSVWHSDMFGRNDFLGEVTMALENKVFDDPLPKFYTLQERTEPLEELLSSRGELIVGLKFVPPESGGGKKAGKGCLQVLVKEAKNLAAVKSNGTSDPFCKSYLLPDKGRSSKQKTPVIRKCCSPAWNHTFTYQGVTLEELSSRSLELTLWDHDRLASNEFLGGVRLNLGTGKHNGKPVDWMDASGKETTLWQRMLERPNLWVESCLSLRPSLDVRNNS